MTEARKKKLDRIKTAFGELKDKLTEIQSAEEKDSEETHNNSEVLQECVDEMEATLETLETSIDKLEMSTE